MLSWFERLVGWSHSPSGLKFDFYLNVVHSINVLALMIPLGLVKKLWTTGLTGATIFLVLSGVFALYKAQQYYSDNYRY